jgi:hypothetical protein
MKQNLISLLKTHANTVDIALQVFFPNSKVQPAADLAIPRLPPSTDPAKLLLILPSCCRSHRTPDPAGTEHSVRALSLPLWVFQPLHFLDSGFMCLLISLGPLLLLNRGVQGLLGLGKSGIFL